MTKTTKTTKKRGRPAKATQTKTNKKAVAKPKTLKKVKATKPLTNDTCTLSVRQVKTDDKRKMNVICAEKGITMSTLLSDMVKCYKANGAK